MVTSCEVLLKFGELSIRVGVACFVKRCRAPMSPKQGPSESRRPRGSARQAALQAARDSIARSGRPDFTLREIANEIGVVHSALYKHFPSRADLLAAVATQGFVELLEKLEDVRARVDDDAVQALRQFCRTHLEFAVANGALYKVMFGPEVVPFDVEGTEFYVAATAVLNFAMASVAACQRAGAVRGDNPMAPGLVFWATLHGLAMLAIDGRLDPKLSDERTVFALLELAVSALLQGL